MRARDSLQNVAKGIDMMRTGMYRDSKGRKVLDTSEGEAIGKMVGLQPASVAREQRRASIGVQNIALAKAEQADITQTWAQGIFEKDPGKVAKAQEQLVEWNRDHPESQIRVSRTAIVKEGAGHAARPRRAPEEGRAEDDARDRPGGC